MYNFRYAKDMNPNAYYRFSQNIPANVRCTVNWLGDGHTPAKKNNFYFDSLVLDCVAQLKRGFNCVCFTREQAEAVQRKFVKRGYHVIIIENTKEDYIELRRESD